MEMLVPARFELREKFRRNVSCDHDSRKVAAVALSQHLDRFGADAFAQPIVCDDDIRCNGQPVELVESVLQRRGRDWPALPLIQQNLHSVAHRRLIVDHEDDFVFDACGHVIRRHFVGCRIACRFERQFDCKARSVSRSRADEYTVVEQIAQTSYYGENKAQAFAAVSLEIADLVELVEDPGQLGRGDADSGVSDFDAQSGAATPAANQNSSALGITHGVRDEVVHDALEQHRVALHQARAALNLELEAFGTRRLVELRPHSVKHRVDAERRHVRVQDTCIQFRDIHDLAEEVFERVH